MVRFSYSYNYRILFHNLASTIFTPGCLSTGKEANVYYAKGSVGSEAEYAVKIFKTSILVFKDRDRYVSGEYRFRNGYCKSNPRKMVRTWAEKEMRNLKRLSSAGIPCPVPRLLKAHILIMDFLGRDGWCSPRLKDANLTAGQISMCYTDLCVIMRRMYYECNLVHGDLSEYNILWHQEQAYIIDVSQSVEHAHPYANELLHKDISNVNDFFKKKQLDQVLSNYQLYQFITARDLRSLLAPNSNSDPNSFSATNTTGVAPNISTTTTQIVDCKDISSDELTRMLNLFRDDPALLQVALPSSTLTVIKSNSGANTIKESQANASTNPYQKKNTLKAASISFKNMNVFNSLDSSVVDDLGESLAEDDDDEFDQEELRNLDERVFSQSYVPASLKEISNPYNEMNRIASGQREAYYAQAVGDMIHGGFNHLSNSTVEIDLKTVKSTSSRDQLVHKAATSPIPVDEAFPWRPKALQGAAPRAGLVFGKPIVPTASSSLISVPALATKSYGKLPSTTFTIKKYVPPTPSPVTTDGKTRYENEYLTDSKPEMPSTNKGKGDSINSVVDAVGVSQELVNGDGISTIDVNKSDAVDNNNEINQITFDNTNVNSHCDSDSGSDKDEDDDSEYEYDEVNEKYRRTLPNRDDAEARAREKALRKEHKKQVKEQAAERRLQKIPKHLKKKAIKNSKAK